MKKNSAKDPETLRREAERLLTRARLAPPYADAQTLNHELEVHRIELELQNEELRNARLESEKNLERYTELYEFAPVGYITLNRQGVILRSNLTFASLLGIERGNLVGLRLGALVQDIPNFNAFLDTLFSQGTKASCEVALTDRGGARRTARIEATLAESGQVCRAILTDITEQKLAEESLRESEQRLAGLVNSAMDAIIVIDERQRIVLYNPAAEAMFGLGADQALGQTLDLLLPRRPRQAIAEHVRSFGPTGTAGHSKQTLDTLSGVRGNGEEFPIEASISQTEVQNGKLHTLILRDITERQQAERAAQEANRHKDEFLALLAHELRNPLAVTTTAVYLLRNKGQTDPETRQWATATISSQTAHLKRLVDELMDVARIGRGILVLQQTQFDLVQVVAEVEQACRPLVDRRHQQLISSLPSGPLWIEADAARLTQVATNLLENACKFTPENGRIELSLRAEGNEAVICVRDTGRGIAAELLPGIFDAFTQGQVALTRDEGGLGLGLALVKKLTEYHGGRVTAKSEGLGKGAEFTVRLPAMSKPPELSSCATTEVAVACNRRILIAEDNAAVGEAMVQVLRRVGHSVRLAQDGAAALEASKAELPEVAIVDIGLPDMDGLAVARGIRKLANGQRLLLIALTSYGQTQDRDRSRAAGFDYHIVKPADVDQLLELINAWGAPGTELKKHSAS